MEETLGDTGFEDGVMPIGEIWEAVGEAMRNAGEIWHLPCLKSLFICFKSLTNTPTDVLAISPS